MDLFDLFAVLPLDWAGGTPPSKRSFPGNLVGFVSLTLFPLLAFVIVLFGPLGTTLVVVLSAAFAVASLLLARLTGSSTASALVMALTCALMCMIAGGIAFLLAVFASFYSAF